MGCFSIIMNTYKHYSFFIMLIDFTEYELETIANAMEDYMQYDIEKLDTDSLFGGLSVERRVLSIQNKIDTVFCKMRGYIIMSSLHHENILEDCFEVAMESFRINNKLTHEQLQELITISKGTYDAICNNAYKIFQDRCI